MGVGTEVEESMELFAGGGVWNVLGVRVASMFAKAACSAYIRTVLIRTVLVQPSSDDARPHPRPGGDSRRRTKPHTCAADWRFLGTDRLRARRAMHHDIMVQGFQN